MTELNFDLSELFSAKDLVVVISGGATGIGYMIAAAFYKTKAKKIYILGRRLEKLQEAAKALDPSGKVVIPLQSDVVDPLSVKKAASSVEADIGYVDVVINNAGIGGPDQKKISAAGSIEELQKLMLDDWDLYGATHAVNTSAVVGVAAAFLPLLDRGNQRRGWKSGKLQPGGEPRQRDVSSLTDGIEKEDLRTSQIITVASIAAFNRFVTASLPYGSSKAGAVALSKALSSLLAPWGIRSNAVCPGVFPSELTQGIQADWPVDKVPAGRLGTPAEMAATFLHLVGKGGAYINGAVEIIDGGRLGVMPATF